MSLLSSSAVGPPPRRLVVVGMVLRSPGKVEDTPFLGLAQGDMAGGRRLGTRTHQTQGWLSLSFPEGIPRTYGSTVLAMSS